MPGGLSPPYPEIYEGLMAGRVIPFLGAGAPLFARNPTKTKWFQRKQGKDAIDFLPTAGELAEYLAARTQLPAGERGELTKMAQYFEAALGAGPLRERLRDIFSHRQPPTPLHQFLASVPAPLLVVTTNYDDLLERAFQAAGKPYDVVVHLTDQEKVLWWEHGQADPQEVPTDDLLLDVGDTSVVYKMHGAIDRRPDRVGHYVITEDDYVEFLTRMTRKSVIPPIFAEPFQDRPFLFLGYGLYDWNWRVILNRIQEFRRNPQGSGGPATPAADLGASAAAARRDAKVRSWAIETLTKPVEQKLWTARGVDVYDGLTLEQFLTELKKQGEDEGGAVAPANAGGGGAA